MRLFIVMMLYVSTICLSAQEYGYITDDNVRLRIGASLSSQVIQKLNFGVKVQILDLGEWSKIDDMEDQWLFIKTADASIKAAQTGWTWGGYIAREMEFRRKSDLSIITENGKHFGLADVRSDIEKIVGRPKREKLLYESGKFGSAELRATHIEVQYDGIILRYRVSDDRLEEFSIASPNYRLANGMRCGISRDEIAAKHLFNEFGIYEEIELLDSSFRLLLHYNSDSKVDQLILTSILDFIWFGR